MSDKVLNGWRVMMCTSSVQREGDRWEVYSPEGSGGVVSTHDVRDWAVRGLLDALAAQPQAGADPMAMLDLRVAAKAASPWGENAERTGAFVKGALWHAQQYGAAQSSLAGEREAVAWRMWSGKRWRFCYSDLHGKRGWEPLMTVAQHERILATWQRTQAAGVPDCERLAELLESVRLGDDEAKPHGSGATYWNNAVLACQVAIRDALAAAPAQPAAQGEFGDAYQGAREDLAIWKRRALEAEDKVRHQDRIIGCLGEELNAINGPAFMGEPVLPAAHDQSEKVAHSAQWPTTPGLSARPSEVQRLREALTHLLSYAERQICAHEETHRGGAIWEICGMCGAKWADDEGGKPEFKWPDEIEAARAALAASTGQEVDGGN